MTDKEENVGQQDKTHEEVNEAISRKRKLND